MPGNHGSGNKLTAADLNSLINQAKGLVHNFGFTATIDTPATGGIRLIFTQGDNSSDPDADGPIRINFSGTQEALQVAIATNLDILAADDFEMDTFGANSETTLFIYAIDRNGTLEFGVGRREDYEFATSDFVTSGATGRDNVLCTAAITANDLCFVIGRFKATYDVSNNDWLSVTANSLVARRPPGPHPRSVVGVWASVDAEGGTVSIADSFNVVSITDVGVGNYTVVFDSDFLDANFAAVATSSQAGLAYIAMITSKATGNCGVFLRQSSDQAPVDHDFNVICIGNK